MRILQQEKARNRDICLIRDKSAYGTSQMCPLKQLCAPSHGSRGSHFKGPGPSPSPSPSSSNSNLHPSATSPLTAPSPSRGNKVSRPHTFKQTKVGQHPLPRKRQRHSPPSFSFHLFTPSPPRFSLPRPAWVEENH